MRRTIPVLILAKLGLFALIFLLSFPVAADFPAIDEPEFTETCRAMYAARDADIEWPPQPAGSAQHCTLRVDGSDPADMAADEYRWALRKSLTFACKGRREVMYDLLRRLADCDGRARSFTMTPAEESSGACHITIEETDERFTAGAPLIDDLIDWRDNMPWYESVLVDLFAPDEFELIVDGLITCGRGMEG